MNERIKELYKQVCGKEWAYDFDTNKAELFALLIVQECANRATWAQDTGENDIGGEVLKHFEVE